MDDFEREKLEKLREEAMELRTRVSALELLVDDLKELLLAMGEKTLSEARKAKKRNGRKRKKEVKKI
jgi:hypothetical protein